MVVVLRDGTWYALDPKRSALVQNSIRKRAQHIDLFGDRSVVISASTVAEMLADERFEDRQRMRSGARKCAAGFWHEPGDGCAHVVRQGVSEPVAPAKPAQPTWKFEQLAELKRRLVAQEIPEPGYWWAWIDNEEQFRQALASEAEWPRYERKGAHGIERTVVDENYRVVETRPASGDYGEEEAAVRREENRKKYTPQREIPRARKRIAEPANAGDEPFDAGA